MMSHFFENPVNFHMVFAPSDVKFVFWSIFTEGKNSF